MPPSAALMISLSSGVNIRSMTSASRFCVSEAYVAELLDERQRGQAEHVHGSLPAAHRHEPPEPGHGGAADDVLELVLNVHAEAELVEDHVEPDLADPVLVLEQVHLAHEQQQVVVVRDVDPRLQVLEGLLEADEVLDLSRDHEGLDDLSGEQSLLSTARS